MSASNNEICLAQLRDILGLRPGASPAAIVAKVRELQFAAAVPGVVIKDQQRALAPSIRVPL